MAGVDRREVQCQSPVFVDGTGEKTDAPFVVAEFELINQRASCLCIRTIEGLFCGRRQRHVRIVPALFQGDGISTGQPGPGLGHLGRVDSLAVEGWRRRTGGHRLPQPVFGGVHVFREVYRRETDRLTELVIAMPQVVGGQLPPQREPWHREQVAKYGLIFGRRQSP